MTRLIFVGGFLGAGKTTLMLEATKNLKASGKKVGLITNDQVADLVDTKLIDKKSVKVEEVTGSCFCCNFKALCRAMEKIVYDLRPDIIIAEPVGSCTDLSATIINPVKDIMRSEVIVSP